MCERPRRLPRTPLVFLVGVLIGTLLPFQIGFLAGRAPSATPQRARRAPSADAAARKPRRPAAPAPSPRPVRHAKARPTPQGDRLAVFEGLGAWVDLFDLHLHPERTMRRLRRSGVRTLYIQTGRSNTGSAVHPAVGPWLVAAHRQRIEVVGWYLPYYARLSKDVPGQVAVARYRYRGHRFDGLGIDIEYRAAVLSRSRWMRQVARHLRLVRRAVGPRYPVAAIPPPPLQMRVAPLWWSGFPWRTLGRHADAILLMSYWSDRSGCPRIRHHCSYGFTAQNVRLTRRLAGRRTIVHVIGGVGDAITDGQLHRFVRAARASGADGASIYDVATTKRAWWPYLRRLRNLGR